MLPKWHLIFGAFFSILIYYFFSLTISHAFLIFLASFLIDFDHYLFFIFKKREFNFKKTYIWFVEKRKKYLKLSIDEKKEYKKAILIFHGIEFWILLILVSFFYKFFLLILIGIFIHMIFDFIELFYFKEPFYSKFSQIAVYIKNKNKKDFN